MNTTRRRVILASLLAISACAGRLAGAVDDKDKKEPAAKPPLSDEEVARLLKQVVDLHNRERDGENLPPLTLNARLTKAARRHALDMARRNKMSHEGGDKSLPLVRIKGAGYRYQRAGENVARGWPKPEDTMRAWMASPHHRDNVLGKYSEIGVALAFAEDGMFYWCVTFGDPRSP